MRDLLFKNLISENKRKKIVASSEVTDRRGVRRVIHRHFICLIKEIQPEQITRPIPSVYVLREHNNLQHLEKFFCRVKGNIIAISNGKPYLILFMHSLKISLFNIPQDFKHNN